MHIYIYIYMYVYIVYLYLCVVRNTWLKVWTGSFKLAYNRGMERVWSWTPFQTL